MGDRGRDGPERGPSWADAVDGWTRALQVGADFQRRMTQNALSSLDVGPGSLRGAQEEWRRYAARVGELTVEYYRAVAAAARDHQDRLTEDRDAGHDHDSSRVADDGRPTEPVAREARDRPSIELRGRTGSVLAASFTVENRDPDPAVVTVTTGLARAPDGERFMAPLSVDPAALTIRPGGTAEISLRLPLLAEVFRPEVTYRVPLHVDGPRPTTIEVVVVADEAPGADDAPAADGAPGADAGPGADATPGDDAPGDDAPGDDARGYRVRCPTCDRIFERTTASLRLRPHKAPDGDDCPERAGRRVRRRS